MQDFDYLIVGAGSAGCVLADRLTENPDCRVLLLEAGGSDRSIFIRMPTALSYPMNMPKYSWHFMSEPEPGLNGRQLHCPRGRTLGGSSSINGMVYVRGHPCDFDEWESHGARGWSYADCLPYFRKSERWNRGADEYRGGDGPVATCGGNEMRLNPLYETFIEAGRQAGYQSTDDYNGYCQEGFGAMHMTVDGGVRASTSHAYLKRAMHRPNLSVQKGVLVHKVIVERRRAVGVEYSKGGKLTRCRALREVILCAGAIGSPHLLQLSGIGSAQVLKDAGVPLIHELPGVGENLQDHLEIYFQFRCKKPITLNSKLDPVNKALIGARWILFKSGLGATNHFESCAFVRSRAGLKWPNIQYHFLPAAMRYDGGKAINGHGFQVHVGPNKPASRGHVRIVSADPRAAPRILFNYLSTEQDIVDWRDCVRLTREIIHQPAMDPYRGEEIQPGSGVRSDGEIDAWIRANVESAYHPSCTCKMGEERDPNAVLDAECRVRGIEGLRVVDSSVFPTVTNGNLNAPTIMVAEKVADAVRGRAPLPPVHAPVWIDPHWDRRQRTGEPLRSQR